MNLDLKNIDFSVPSNIYIKTQNGLEKCDCDSKCEEGEITVKADFPVESDDIYIVAGENSGIVSGFSADTQTEYTVSLVDGVSSAEDMVTSACPTVISLHFYSPVKSLSAKYKYVAAKTETDIEVLNKYIEKSKEYNSLERKYKKVEDVNTQLKKRSAQNAAALVESRNLAQAVDLIHNSFSWKITAPIRAISAVLRRLTVFKGLIYLKNNGLKATLRRIIKGPGPVPVSKNKLAEISRDYYISEKRRNEEESVKFNKDIKFSVLVPLYNTPEKFLREMIESVQAQTYKNWELCLADGSDKDHEDVGKIVGAYAKSDNRIKYEKLEKNSGISENTNACIRMSTGDYIALFDHDDLLHPSALYEVMKAICDHGADYIYTDENTFSEEPKDAYYPHFKPDYSPDTLRSINYICHLSVFSRELLDSVGYFRSECDGSQDYDIILRLTEKAKKVWHIRKILYYWRAHKNSVAQDLSAKPYTIVAAKKALKDHLERLSLKGEVVDSSVLSSYHIKYEIEGNPLISILIPNKDHTDDLDNCLKSIFEKSTYTNLEFIIIENNSTEKETFDYYERIQREHSNVKVVKWDSGFNYSAINNYGAGFAKGEYILLLNNDVEIINGDCFEEMLMFAQRSDVGAVGAKLYYPDETVQHAGVILGIGGIAGHSHKDYPRNSPGYASRASYAQNLTACTAACLMLRKDVYDEVGGLDEEFKVAFNDVDLCMKIRSKGYLIVFTPYAELYHYESKSRGAEDTPEKIARFQGEIKRFEDKWKKELDEGDPYYNPNLTLVREDFSFK